MINDVSWKKTYAILNFKINNKQREKKINI